MPIDITACRAAPCVLSLLCNTFFEKREEKEIMKARKFSFSRRHLYCAVKLGFGAVLLQLLYASLTLEGLTRTSASCVPDILECAAASATFIFAGAYLIEKYIFE